jgi:cyclase
MAAVTEVAVTREMNSASGLMLVCTLFLASVTSAQNNANWTFTPYHVQGNVHMLEPINTNGNVGVFVGEDAVLLVDSHFQPSVPQLLDEIGEMSDQEIEFVINTHVHPDHIGGNSLLADYGVTIVAHDTVRLQMLEELRIPRNGGTFFPQPAANALPVLSYSEAISFHLNGEEVRVFKAPPAHTGGDSFVYFMGSDVLHLGDVFRTNMYPIVDKYNGGSFLGMIEAMGLAIGMAGPNTKVIPGHGPGFTDRVGMMEYQDMLFALRDLVAEAIARGDSLDEILAANLTRDLDDRWLGDTNWGPVDLLPIIHEELMAQ